MFYGMKRRVEVLFLEAREQRANAQAATEDKAKMASTLETSAKQLTSVGITKDYRIFEVRAAAKATGRTLADGPEYKFSMFINAPPDVLSAIQQVTYHLQHPTFRQQDYVSTNSKDNFSEGYTGWGCLPDVAVTVLFKNGESQMLEFNMCQSLGPGWWP